MFKLGDKVTWNSKGIDPLKYPNQSHHGVVTEVVSAGDMPSTYRHLSYGVWARNDTSYVITEDRKTFWPPISRLRLEPV